MRQRGKIVSHGKSICYVVAMNVAVHSFLPGRESDRGPSAARFDVDEFIALMPAFDLFPARFELDHGTLTRMAPPNYPHARLQHALATQLRALLLAEGSPLVFTELGVRIGADVVRIIDIAVFDEPGDERHLVDAGLVRLAVEIADTTLIGDLGSKALDYADAGIADYWVVDVAARVVHVHSQPTSEGFRTRGVVAFGQPMHAACLPEPVIFEG